MAVPMLTPEGRAALADRLDRLRAERAALGPILADPELERRLDDRYDQLWTEIDALEALLAVAGVLPERGGPDGSEPGLVGLGSVVEIRLVGGGVERIRIVHPAEAFLDAERVSAAAPVARALLGRRAGDRVTVTTPGGPTRVTVLAVDPEPVPAG